MKQKITLIYHEARLALFLSLILYELKLKNHILKDLQPEVQVKAFTNNFPAFVELCSRFIHKLHS